MTAHLLLPGSQRVPVEPGGDPYHAVLRAVRASEAAGLHPVRLDAGDWLTFGAIASRIGVSRELVRLWCVGQRGPGGFPPPLNPGRETSFYSWYETTGWLRAHKPDWAPRPHDPALVAMNLAVQLRRLAPRIARLDAVVDCITG